MSKLLTVKVRTRIFAVFPQKVNFNCLSLNKYHAFQAQKTEGKQLELTTYQCLLGIMKEVLPEIAKESIKYEI